MDASGFATVVKDPRLIHLPVLPVETIQALALRPHGRYLDCTVGLGGHAEAILTHAPDCLLCGIDRDPVALNLARERLAPYGARVHLFHSCYSNFADCLQSLQWESLDGVLLDLGVSSMQLDDDARGFSFFSNARLDMRMDQSANIRSAWDLVNRESFAFLRECLATLGEEPLAERIAHKIVTARQKAPLNTAQELAALVVESYPPAWRHQARNHPATRTFQALRLAVNDELGELRRFLQHILPVLATGGRIVCLTFHSLEDRLVKQFMRRYSALQVLRLVSKKPLRAGDPELAQNPRASSAKLRVAEKISSGSTGTL